MTLVFPTSRITLVGIARNAHPTSTKRVLCDSVSEVTERHFFDENEPFVAGTVLSMSGGSPCQVSAVVTSPPRSSHDRNFHITNYGAQGFSMLNRHRRDDDVRTFEPFVFVSGMSLHRPLYAL